MANESTQDSFDLKMYNKTKASIEITPAEPQFLVRYVGKTEVYVAIGKGCTQTAVQRIWDNYYDEKSMDRASILINSTGIIICFLESKRPDHVVDIKNIAYCCAERGLHNMIFAWICKDEKTKKLECHAVLCSSVERAQLMALTLHRSFHVAYKDWKHKKERRARSKANAARQNNISRNNSAHSLDERMFSHGSSTSQDSGSVSGDSDGDPEVNTRNSVMETRMAQMYLAEEEEFTNSVMGD